MCPGKHCSSETKRRPLFHLSYHVLLLKMSFLHVQQTHSYNSLCMFCFTFDSLWVQCSESSSKRNRSSEMSWGWGKTSPWVFWPHPMVWVSQVVDRVKATALNNSLVILWAVHIYIWLLHLQSYIWTPLTMLGREQTEAGGALRGRRRELCFFGFICFFSLLGNFSNHPRFHL